MTSRHGGEAMLLHLVGESSLEDTGGSILNCWAFLYFTLLETSLEGTVSSVSNKEVVSVVC